VQYYPQRVAMLEVDTTAFIGNYFRSVTVTGTHTLNRKQYSAPPVRRRLRRFRYARRDSLTELRRIVMDCGDVIQQTSRDGNDVTDVRRDVTLILVTKSWRLRELTHGIY